MSVDHFYTCLKCGHRWSTQWGIEATPRFLDACPNCLEYTYPDGYLASWQETRAMVWDNSNAQCYYCETELHPIRNFHIGRLRPKSKGGTDALHNLVASCKRCNHRSIEQAKSQGGIS